MKTSLKQPALRRRNSLFLAHCLVIGACSALLALSAQAGTLIISNGSPVRIFVPSSDIGADWRGPGFDDSAWLAGANGVGYEAVPLELNGIVLADSVSEWSFGGHQGENNWIYGYYDKTADPEEVYTADKFRPFVRSDGPWSPINFWDGGAWNWNPDNIPWDTIGQTFIHPNGTNSGGMEHWSIRRWRSTVSGPVTLKFHLAKAAAAGNGVTGKAFKNGTELFTQTIAGSDLAGFSVLIPTSVSLGDYLDFAMTPVGTVEDGVNGLGSDGSDGSYMTAQVLDGTLIEPVAAANSVNDWGSGAQGENGWYYGFWNVTADPDGIYNPATDFNNTDPNWTFDGAHWSLGPGDPPWDTIGQSDWHPNGINNGHVDWVIRRWVSTLDGDLNVRVIFAKQNTGCGNGTTLHVLHNGVEKFSRTIAGGDGTGIDTFVFIGGVVAGDLIEFALDPLGTDGLYEDGCDGSTFQAIVYPAWLPSLRPLITTDLQSQMMGLSASVYLRYPFEVPNPTLLQSLKLKIRWNDGYAIYLNGAILDKKNAPTVTPAPVADSIADWSTTGEVGYRGWSYGYYDRSMDDDGIYQAQNFTPFPHDGLGYSATDFWNGSGYDWFNGNPPWTELYQEATHPNAPNGAVPDPGNPGTHEIWNIRRWTATVDGNFKCRFRFYKTNVAPGCSDGVSGYVFKNSTMLYSNTIAGTDGVGRDDVVDLGDLLQGDQMDFLLSAGPNANDWCDASVYSASIFPGEAVIPWDGAATARRTANGSSATWDILDLTGLIPQLNEGANLLAVQAMNVSNSDADFLFALELTGNRAPTASPDGLLAMPDTPTTITRAELIANDTDPDGDPLMLVGVSPYGMSAAGGLVRLMGETVYYTPPVGFIGADSFSYTITDSSGIPVSSEVNVAVGGLQNIQIGNLPGGGIKVTCYGAPVSLHRLERSETMAPGSWVQRDQITSGLDGYVELADLSPPADHAFYRVVWVTSP